MIAGGGGVLAHALATEFAGAGYAVTSLRRQARAGADNPAREVACELHDALATREALQAATAHCGAVDVLVFNAAHLVAAPFAELTLRDFEETWRVGVAGAVACTQTVLPSMLANGGGTIVFTGATASLRGGAQFAAFATAKFALRGLAQSLARELQPQGIHVAHVVLDGLLLGSPSVQRFGGAPSRTIDPVDVARTYRWLAEQNRSAWTHELDLRPHSERF